MDRGALDAALAASFPCGGWCPAGRKAEDGRIPGRYPLSELPDAGYPERTRRNVLDSDGTLIVYFGELAGGTAKTAHLCEQHHKPALVVDGLESDVGNLATAAAEFVKAHGIRVLNVAGPRESGHAGGRDFAERVVREVIKLASRHAE